MPDSSVGQTGASRKPPVSCGNCGAEITFEPGQLVGDPAAVERVTRYRKALERVASGDFSMAMAEDMQRTAQEALDG